MSQYKRAAIVGFGWQAFGLVGQQAIQLIANLIFARVLLKEENGLIIACMAVTEYATLLRAAGLTQAFVSYEGEDAETRHTVFWASLATGILTAAALFAAAPTIGGLLNSPRSVPILKALSAIQLIDSLRVVPLALVWRHLRFRERAIADGVPFLVGLIAAIIGVIVLPQDQKVWSLVLMYIVRAILQAVLFNVYQPYRPKVTFDWSFFRLISKRSASFLGVNLPSSILEPLPALFTVGRAGEAAGGSFGLASKVTSPAEKLAHAANQTLLPIFSKIKSEPERLRDAVLRSFRGVGFVSTAALAFIWVSSPELIPFVLGEKWRSAAPAAQWLAIAAAFRLYSYTAATALLAINKAIYSVVTWSVTLLVALALLGMWPIAFGDSVTGAKLVAAYTALGFVGGVGALCGCLPVAPSAILKSLAPSTLSSLGALAVAWLGAELIQGPDAARLLAKLLLFTVTFLPLAGYLLSGSPKALLSKEGWLSLLRQS